ARTTGVDNRRLDSASSACCRIRGSSARTALKSVSVTSCAAIMLPLRFPVLRPLQRQLRRSALYLPPRLDTAPIASSTLQPSGLPLPTSPALDCTTPWHRSQRP